LHISKVVLSLIYQKQKTMTNQEIKDYNDHLKKAGKNKVTYAWCIETFTNDEYEDITNLNHSDELTYTKDDFEAEEGESTRLALIRSEGNEIDGLTDQLWAYVKDGKLPGYFSESLERETSYKVPQKYHKELEKFNSK
jgi:hypothetical protein